MCSSHSLFPYWAGFVTWRLVSAISGRQQLAAARVNFLDKRIRRKSSCALPDLCGGVCRRLGRRDCSLAIIGYQGCPCGNAVCSAPDLVVPCKPAALAHSVFHHGRPSSSASYFVCEFK